MIVEVLAILKLPKTNARLGGDFGGRMPTGLKGHQQLSSGRVAKPSERQSRPLGAAAQLVIIELSRERHHAPWRVQRSAICYGTFGTLVGV
jgi:hypothetical protein